MKIAKFIRTNSIYGINGIKETTPETYTPSEFLDTKGLTFEEEMELLENDYILTRMGEIMRGAHELADYLEKDELEGWTRQAEEAVMKDELPELRTIIKTRKLTEDNMQSVAIGTAMLSATIKSLDKDLDNHVKNAAVVMSSAMKNMLNIGVIKDMRELRDVFIEMSYMLDL